MSTFPVTFPRPEFKSNVQYVYRCRAYMWNIYKYEIGILKYDQCRKIPEINLINELLYELHAQ
jgi:hypothetical protein